MILDAYDPSEYDPFFLTTSTDWWKVSTPTLQDPLLRDIQRKLTETGIIKQCETGRPCSTRELNKLSRELPLLPLSRQHTDALEWLKIPHSYIASDAYQRKSAVCDCTAAPGSKPEKRIPQGLYKKLQTPTVETQTPKRCQDLVLFRIRNTEPQKTC